MFPYIPTSVIADTATAAVKTAALQQKKSGWLSALGSGLVAGLGAYQTSAAPTPAQIAPAVAPPSTFPVGPVLILGGVLVAVLVLRRR